jgi:hypothetical protein
MIGLVIFLIIMAIIMMLLEAALLTYVLRWGAFRQSLLLFLRRLVVFYVRYS